MAQITTLTPDQQAEYERWVAERPPVVQEMIRRRPPGRLYFNKSVPGQRVVIHSYEEDGTVTVLVPAEYNMVMFERRVFGVPIDNLEECDLPGPDEPTGAVLTDPEGIEAFTEAARPVVMRGREA